MMLRSCSFPCLLLSIFEMRLNATAGQHIWNLAKRTDLALLGWYVTNELGLFIEAVACTSLGNLWRCESLLRNLITFRSTWKSIVFSFDSKNLGIISRESRGMFTQTRCRAIVNLVLQLCDQNNTKGFGTPSFQLLCGHVLVIYHCFALQLLSQLIYTFHAQW